MSKESLDHYSAQWEKLMAAAKAFGGDLPLMESLRRQLGGQMQDVRRLQDRRSELQEETRKSTQELRSSQSRAGALAARIKALARAAILDSAKLGEFGIKQRPKRRFARLPVALERKEDEAPRNPTTR
ncbi:MAG TPA: hypothetical protein VGG20_25175 [Thermoanaerobaculia bacterium]|jgi:hypothetical protein